MSNCASCCFQWTFLAHAVFYEHSWHMLFLWTFLAFIRKSPTRVLQLTYSRFAVGKSPTRVLQSAHAFSVSPVLDGSIVWTFCFRERARWSLHRLCICTHPAEPAAQPKSRAPDAHQRSQKHASSTRIVHTYMTMGVRLGRYLCGHMRINVWPCVEAMSLSQRDGLNHFSQ